jgi:hypothetical protein
MALGISASFLQSVCSSLFQFTNSFGGSSCMLGTKGLEAIPKPLKPLGCWRVCVCTMLTPTDEQLDWLAERVPMRR